eukprot:495973-Rhodomonas_salina.1
MATRFLPLGNDTLHSTCELHHDLPACCTAGCSPCAERPRSQTVAVRPDALHKDRAPALWVPLRRHELGGARLSRNGGPHVSSARSTGRHSP